MAALDVLQLVAVQGTASPVTVTFSSVAAGDLLVFVVMRGTGTSVVTPPSGVTAYTNVDTEWPALATYARVAQAGDSTSWAFGFSNTDSNVIHGYRIEGPFTDLTGVTITADASFTSNTSRKVLLSDVTVAANTLVIAAACHYGSSTLAFTNSFTNAQNTVGIGAGILGTARRLYTTSATDVSSTASWTGADSGNTALIRILAPTTTSTITPDSTVSNTSWSTVGAASLHAALVTGDTDYITASTTGAVTELGLSNPAAPLTLTDVSFRVRARLS